MVPVKISTVTHSPWTAAIVPVAKSDPNEIRICRAFKLTVNRAARWDTYPIPSLSDLFNSKGGGGFFTKLDMSQAYAQLELDEKSKILTVINTLKGCFSITVSILGFPQPQASTVSSRDVWKSC